MTEKFLQIIGLLALITICFLVNCWLFDTPFAEVSIDWFAFLAGMFLVLEGSWKILTSKRRSFFNQLFRITRIIIGMNVFTIHLLQFMRY
ncbi:MAG: hypothetical protein WBD17_00080 [Candidatus Omnitrophota bacterium]